MKINSIPSPASHVIFPGTSKRVINLERHEAKIRKQEEAELSALEEQTKKLQRENQRNKAALAKAHFPGTLDYSFKPVTGPVSVTETEVRQLQGRADRAIAQGKIPPAAGQGGFLDVVI